MRFPRTHLLLLGILGLGLTSVVVAKFSADDTERYTTESVLLEVPAAATNLQAELTPAPEAVPAALEAPPPPPARLVEKHTRVKSGDNLANIFRTQGIAQRELALLLETKPLGPQLKRIFPGHEFTFTLNNDSQLIKLTYSPGPLKTLAFERAGDRFVGHEVQREPEVMTAYKHAVIDSSLFAASQRAGLDDALTMKIARIFQWDIDFVLDIRKGDEFYVLFEEQYLGDKFIGYGDVIAAEFINQGDSYQAALYRDEAGRVGHYNPEGRNMKKAFLRAPVEFSRISSNFNLRRKHPLYKRTMPHRGIDYAAPSGTPVIAAGDGRVQTASRSDANGNFVVIQHGEQFVTKYLHLSKFARGVRKGSRVKQGQIVGYVGATGWATGPHLHYEFLVNGVHQNPRTVKLPDANPVPKQEFARFASSTTPYFSLLENYREQIQLAMAR